MLLGWQQDDLAENVGDDDFGLRREGNSVSACFSWTAGCFLFLLVAKEQDVFSAVFVVRPMLINSSPVR